MYESCEAASIARPILIVDDDPADRLRFKYTLKAYSGEFPTFLEAGSVDHALDLLQQSDPACCLLDFDLSGGYGTEFLERIRRVESPNTLPVVAVTGYNHSDVAASMLKAGAHDYLVKDELSRYSLYRAIQHAIDTCSLQTKLLQLAHQDPLTGLLNRSLFMDRLEQTVLSAGRYEHQCALVYLDVDHFKQINDTYGHDIGDEVLKTYASRIRQCCRETDHCARLGGDEFVVLLPQITMINAALVGEKLLNALNQPIDIDGFHIEASPSMGIAHCPTTAKDAADLLSQADKALYQVKKAGRAQCLLFSGEQLHQVNRLNDLKRRLPEAVTAGQLDMQYQVAFSTDTFAPVAIDVSSRFQCEEGEANGLELATWIRDMRLEGDYHSWLFNSALQGYSAHPGTGHIKLALGTIYCQRVARDIINTFKSVTEKTGMDTKELVVVVRESDLARQNDQGASFITLLFQNGFDVSIDQFGSSGLALNQLIGLPISSLRIDLQTRPATTQCKDMQGYLSGLVTFAHSLGLRCHIKGIAQSSELEVAIEAGCDSVQGPYLHKTELVGDMTFQYLQKLSAASIAPSRMIS